MEFNIFSKRVDKFFGDLVIDLNYKCLRKCYSNLYKTNIKWSRENFIPNGRKFNIIGEGCSNEYGNMCSSCCQIIISAREQFKEIYFDELENRTESLESQVKSLKESLDKMSKFAETV